MSLEEGGKSGDILLSKLLCHFMVSLVNFTSREPEEYSVARAIIMPNAKANFGLANVVEKECVGKKVRQIYRNFVMIAGLM